MAQAMAVNQPKAPERGQELKASQYGYNQGKYSKISRCFTKGLKSKSMWGLLGFCLISRGDDGPRRSNLIEEDDDLNVGHCIITLSSLSHEIMTKSSTKHANPNYKYYRFSLRILLHPIMHNLLGFCLVFKLSLIHI